MIRFNARTDNGVASWLIDNHPARLSEVATPERIEEHRRALLLLALNYYKLLHELEEIDASLV